MQLNIPHGIPSGAPATYKLGHCDTIELLREYDMNGYQHPLSRCVDHLPSSVQVSGKVITGTYLNGTAVTACVGASVPLSGSIQLVDASGDSELGLLANNGLTGRDVQIFRRTSTGSYPSTPYLTTTAEFIAGTYTASVGSSVPGSYYFKAVFSPASGSQDELTLNADTSGEKHVTFISPPCD